MNNAASLIQGRGAQMNPSNPFSLFKKEDSTPKEYWDEHSSIKTVFTEVDAKSILNKVKSPDINSNWSANPYQGCEHGCVYCYARNTHPYWGYSAGLDFEQKIMVKNNAAVLLNKKLQQKSWLGEPIMLSGNTDCYQPVERKLKITRSMLEVMWAHRQCVTIVTKNSLILRDMSLLQKMAKEKIVKVAISLSTLNEDLRNKLEPRTASVQRRLHTIRTLSEAGIPVHVLMAPIIPGLNDHEIFDVVKAVSEMGAVSASYIVVRLNGEVENIFEDWMTKIYPQKATKVMNQIKSCHGGHASDSRFGTRMAGEGHHANIIKQQFDIAYDKYFSGRHVPQFNTSLYLQRKQPQLELFA